MKVALIQMSSVLDYKVNLEFIDDQIKEIKLKSPGVSAIFLPEVFYSMSDGESATPYLIEEGNEHFSNISNIAKTHNIYLLGGSAATLRGEDIVNRCYNFAPDGSLMDIYDKMHLFSVNLKGKTAATIIDESKVYSSGSELKVLDVEGFRLGLSICFDLRFPELYREYFSMGANILTISSAFTIPTGKAHWETLVRARAIENQSYVIATNQCGIHNDKIKTYGHSLIVDPWGEIIGQCFSEVGHVICDLDQSVLNKVRGRIDMTSKLLT